MDRQPCKKVLGTSKKRYKTPPDRSIHLFVVVVNIVFELLPMLLLLLFLLLFSLVVVAEVAVVIKTGRVDCGAHNDGGEDGKGGFKVRGVGLDGSGSIDSGGGRGGGYI